MHAVLHAPLCRAVDPIIGDVCALTLTGDCSPKRDLTIATYVICMYISVYKPVDPIVNGPA